MYCQRTIYFVPSKSSLLCFCVFFLFYRQTPTPLPDALRGEQYAFVGMPVSEFRKGNINDENIGVGR